MFFKNDLPQWKLKRLIASMLKHPAVEEAWVEPDGVWCELKIGWEGDDGVHSIRVDDAAHWKDEKFWIRKGKCDACLRGVRA
jgi:hypothetical protein